MPTPKRLIANVEFDVFADERVTNNPNDLAFSERAKFTEDAMTDFDTRHRVVTDGTTDELISFGITATWLYIKTDQEISIKINGGTESFKVKGPLMWNGEFTQIEVTNASGADACVKFGYGK